MTKVMNISFEGIEMPCSVFGQGEKTMVMLPGVSVKDVAWSAGAVAAQYRLLTEKYTVWLFDRRTNISDGYSIADMAEDTAAVMEHLGLRDTYMLGASQGGMVAMCIAARHPELVRKLAVASSAARGNDFSDRVFSRWIELAEKKDRTELTRDFLSTCYSPASFEAMGNVFERLGRTFSDAELEHYAIITKALLGCSVMDELKMITCPMLNIGSTADRVFGEAGCREIAENSQCESYIYTEGYGHSVYDEAPDFTRRVFEFFEA